MSNSVYIVHTSGAVEKHVLDIKINIYLIHLISVTREALQHIDFLNHILYSENK